MTELITRRLDGQQLTRDLELAFNALLESAEDFEGILNNSYFRETIAHTAVKNVNSPQTETMQKVIAQVIEDTRSYVQAYLATLPPPPTQAVKAANEIAELVPEQKTGPLRFAIVGGVVRVEHQPATVISRDSSNVTAARQELIAAGQAGADYLRSANFDHRLTDEIKSIVARLSASQDIIALGVAALAFQQIVESFKDELPNFWSAKLQGFSLDLSMYVAQFLNGCALLRTQPMQTIAERTSTVCTL